MTVKRYRYGNVVLTVNDDQVVGARPMAGPIDRGLPRLPKRLRPSREQVEMHERAARALAGVRQLNDAAPEGAPPSGGMAMVNVDPDGDPATNGGMAELTESSVSTWDGESLVDGEQVNLRAPRTEGAP